MSGLPRWRMRQRELFGMGQRMRWPSRRSMLRLAPPIMIGGDPALARRFAPKGAPPPSIPRC